MIELILIGFIIFCTGLTAGILIDHYALPAIIRQVRQWRK